jgi:hypothetical protein
VIDYTISARGLVVQTSHGCNDNIVVPLVG